MRPRYGRIASATTSVLVTMVAVLGGIGLVPGSVDASASMVAASDDDSSDVPDRGLSDAALALLAHQQALRLERLRGAGPARPNARTSARPTDALALPARSGKGRRVVFDMSEQRVWLVAAGDRVRRSYLVSGSVTDNLGPGTYEVYSKSRHAIGIDDSGTMQYMVRFTHGDRAAIGFHDIPVDDGRLVQTRAELGTPQSHGCIRQARPDARALWRFAPVGTTVVVTA